MRSNLISDYDPESVALTGAWMADSLEAHLQRLGHAGFPAIDGPWACTSCLRLHGAASGALADRSVTSAKLMSSAKTLVVVLHRRSPCCSSAS